MIREVRSCFPRVSIHRMCALLGVSRSLVYVRCAPPSFEAELLAIERLVTTYLGYGYRRVARAMQADGFSVTEYSVRKLMRDHGLLARRPRSRGVTRAGARDRRACNLAKGMRARHPNELWGADTTRLTTDSGPVYLAAILDLFSRKVVGWSLSRRNDEALVADCLRRALDLRRPDNGWIHHSDQGSTYTASGYTRIIRDYGGRCSLSAPGKPRDNAHVESFFRTLKLEEIDRNRYESFLEAQHSIGRFIEQIYNATRMHSALEYMSPDQFESRLAGETR